MLEKELDPIQFFRANRQFIVNVQSIQRINNFFRQTKILHLKDYPDISIKVSKDKAARLREWIVSL